MSQLVLQDIQWIWAFYRKLKIILCSFLSIYKMQNKNERGCGRVVLVFISILSPSHTDLTFPNLSWFSRSSSQLFTVLPVFGVHYRNRLNRLWEIVIARSPILFSTPSYFCNLNKTLKETKDCNKSLANERHSQGWKPWSMEQSSWNWILALSLLRPVLVTCWGQWHDSWEGLAS
jgi:hypothetical protein